MTVTARNLTRETLSAESARYTYAGALAGYVTARQGKWLAEWVGGAAAFATRGEAVDRLAAVAAAGEAHR